MSFPKPFSLLLLAVSSMSCVAENVLSTYQGDSQNTSHYKGSTASGFDSVKWQFKTGGKIFGSAAVTETTVFVGSEDKHLYALDKNNGEVRWKFKSYGDVFSTPTVTEALVVFGSADGYLYALERKTGQLQWKFKTEGEQWHSQFSLWGKTPMPDGSMQRDAWDFYPSSPTVAGDKVYYGSGDQHLYAIDLKSGKQQWKFKTQGVVHTSAAVADGKVIFGSWDSNLYALDQKSGLLQWFFAAKQDPKGHLMTGFQGSPAISDGIVYVGNRDANLYALDLASGKLLWNHDTKTTWLSSSPAIDENNVYFGTSDTTEVIALDKKSGEFKFRVDTKLYTFSPPAVTDKSLLVGSMDGKLYVIDKTSGDIRWTYQTEASKNDPYELMDEQGNRAKDFGVKIFRSAPGLQGSYQGVDRMHTSLGSFLAAPVVDKNVVYIGSADGTLYALQAR